MMMPSVVRIDRNVFAVIAASAILRESKTFMTTPPGTGNRSWRELAHDGIGVVVDPSEERIKSEFDQVTRTYLPMHSVIRIDEVEKQGTSKISKVEGSNIAQFPMPIYTPGDKSS